MTGYVATAIIDIGAPPSTVWRVLVDPERIREYMFGSEVVTDWRPGSPILFRGEWEGKPYEDKGTIVTVDEPRLLRYTHYSPLSGAPDVPESYHTLTYTLEETPEGTRVTLTQDNNDTREAAAHSEKMWRQVVEVVRRAAEA
jgi:uncharacterized protein YndB with AHSA1/START domain